MFNVKNTSIAVLLLAAGLPSSAQAIKFSGLAQIWYSQVMDNNLRLNADAPYHPMRSEWKENGFSIRRTDVKLTGSLGDVLGEVFEGVEWELMFDPSLSSNILQDVAIRYKMPYQIEFKVGQFKPYQTLDGMTTSAEMLFAERSMLGRVFGDPRDRGFAASIGFGEAKAFGGRFHVGVFNGSGKANDANAQKDFVARLDMNYSKRHIFGAYMLQGSTDLADKGSLVPLTFSGANAPSSATILDNKDKTSNVGAFYRFEDNKFHASFEAITGLLGRRNSSLATATGASNREHLDQKFLGYTGIFGYTFGRHTLLARYDVLNFNQGENWYGDSNPYLRANGDFTPDFTEVTFGYIFAFLPEKFKNANVKANYVMRSKNTLLPREGQIGEQGGDSLIICFHVSF